MLHKTHFLKLDFLSLLLYKTKQNKKKTIKFGKPGKFYLQSTGRIRSERHVAPSLYSCWGTTSGVFQSRLRRRRFRCWAGDSWTCAGCWSNACCPRLGICCCWSAAADTDGGKTTVSGRTNDKALNDVTMQLDTFSFSVDYFPNAALEFALGIAAVVSPVPVHLVKCTTLMTLIEIQHTWTKNCYCMRHHFKIQAKEGSKYFTFCWTLLNLIIIKCL